MPGSKSDYLEAKLMDHVLGGLIYTPPSILYIALYTSAPNDAGDYGVEVTGGSYSRCMVNNDMVNWSLTSGSVKTNSQAFTFTQATDSWGSVVALGIFDSLTGGNLLFWADISTIAVSSGDIVRILPSGITVTSD